MSLFRHGTDFLHFIMKVMQDLALIIAHFKIGDIVFRVRVKGIILVFICFFHTILNIVLQRNNIFPDITLHLFVREIGGKCTH